MYKLDTTIINYQTLKIFRVLKIFFIGLALLFGLAYNTSSAEETDLKINASIRLMYSFFERTHLCLLGKNLPNFNQYYVKYDRKSQRLIYKNSCSINSSLSEAIRTFNFNIIQSDINIIYKTNIDNSLTLSTITKLTSFSSDKLTVEKTLFNIDGSWGYISLGMDKHWISKAIITGYIDGGVGNISDDALINENTYSSSRENGASYAPHKLLPISYLHADPRILAMFKAKNGFSFGTGLALSSRQSGPERDGIHLSMAFISRFDQYFASKEGRISTSLSVVARPFFGDDSNGKYNRILLTGATQFGLNIDYKNFKSGFGLSYSLNSADAFSGKMCLTQDWKKLRTVCRDQFAFQISAGYVFRNITLGGGIFTGFMTDAVQRNEITRLFGRSETIKSVPNDIYALDSYIRFGFGADIALDDNIKIFVDSIYSIDNIASKESTNITNDSYSVAIQGGVNFSF